MALNENYDDHTIITEFSLEELKQLKAYYIRGVCETISESMIKSFGLKEIENRNNALNQNQSNVDDDFIENVYVRSVSREDSDSQTPSLNLGDPDAEFQDALEVKLSPGTPRLEGDGCDNNRLDKGLSNHPVSNHPVYVLLIYVCIYSPMTSLQDQIRVKISMLSDLSGIPVPSSRY